jgi:hypothetical protein
MKLFVLFAVAAVIVGGVYHKEVSQYFADHAGSSQSGSATSVVNSMQRMGNSSNALLGGVNNALDR